jgi:hypothetical protein
VDLGQDPDGGALGGSCDRGALPGQAGSDDEYVVLWH